MAPAADQETKDRAFWSIECCIYKTKTHLFCNGVFP
jgi:hypothetical protein